MDLGKNDLKIITETLVTVLHEHTSAVEKGLDPKKLIHETIISSLLRTIEKYRVNAPVIHKMPDPGNTEVQVLHGAPVELSPKEQPKREPEMPPEGPKDRTLAQSNANGSGAGAPIGQAETPPLERPTNSPVVTSAPSVPTSPVASTDEVTLDNIDTLSEGLTDDSLEEPRIEKPKVTA